MLVTVFGFFSSYVLGSTVSVNKLGSQTKIHPAARAMTNHRRIFTGTMLASALPTLRERSRYRIINGVIARDQKNSPRTSKRVREISSVGPCIVLRELAIR